MKNFRTMLKVDHFFMFSIYFENMIKFFTCSSSLYHINHEIYEPINRPNNASQVFFTNLYTRSSKRWRVSHQFWTEMLQYSSTLVFKSKFSFIIWFSQLYAICSFLKSRFYHQFLPKFLQKCCLIQFFRSKTWMIFNID